MTRNLRRVSLVQPGMNRLSGIVAAAAVPLIMLSACARPGSLPAAASSSSGTPSSAPAEAGADTLVLRSESYGGFVPASRTLGRIPAISVYADGRVITTGPEPAIYPGPALPNVLVQMVSPDVVQELIKKGEAAGIRNGTDYGRPNVADAPTTRVTLDGPDGKQVVTAEALNEAQPSDTRLTTEQKQARTKLADFVKLLTAVPGDQGVSSAVAYQPTGVAVFSQPYTAQSSQTPGPSKTWAGSALPGPYLYPATKTGCLIYTGAAKDKVLAAAKDSTKITGWTDGGKEWLLTFRPLLPDETTCAQLKN